jgi:hypothetical protein
MKYRVSFSCAIAGIAMSYRMEDQDSISGRDKNLYVLHTVQTGSRAHPVTYPMGTGGSFPRGNVAGS